MDCGHIGDGNYGTVSKMKYPRTNTEMAVKVCGGLSQSHNYAFNDSLTTLQCIHVVWCIDVVYIHVLLVLIWLFFVFMSENPSARASCQRQE